MRAAIVSIVIASSAGMPNAALGQTPQGAPPPSYGTTYTSEPVPALPVPLPNPLQFFEMRRFRDWQLTVTLMVPTAEVQAVLPAGYTVPNPGAISTGVSVAFVLQERVELMTPLEGFAAGSYGPVDEVLVLTLATNPLGAPENVILDNLRSTEEAVTLTNGIFGPASARLATTLDVGITAGAQADTLHFGGMVAAGKLSIQVDAIVSSTVAMTSVRNRVVPTPFRYVDNSVQPTVANRSVRAGVGVDQIVAVPIEGINVKVKAKRIPLAQGTLTVLSVASGRLDRWQELVQKVQ